jgi:hypothetical protein
VENLILGLVVLFSVGVIILVVALVLYVAAIPVALAIASLGVVLASLLKAGEWFIESCKELTRSTVSFARFVASVARQSRRANPDRPL